MQEKLKEVYDPQKFRKDGHDLIDLLADYLEGSKRKENEEVLDFQTPDKMYQKWKQEKHQSLKGMDFYKAMIDDCTNVHHRQCIGHQISPPAPTSALASLVSAFMNNGMGVYEMGSSPTAIERLVVEVFANAIGYDMRAGGFLTSGGTLANLTALLTARNLYKEKNIWEEGSRNRKLALMVSDQAHYCVDRAARIMGLGKEGVIHIKTNEQYQAKVESLEEAYVKATKEGFEIFAIVGSAGTTSTGSYDPIEQMGSFAKEKNIWFHVDGAHGGAVVFSEKYKLLAKGIAMADSVIIDCHKMLMAPAILTTLVYKDGNKAYQTFSQDAKYLLQQHEAEQWYDIALRSFECTKEMMSIKVYSIINEHGVGAFNDFVTRLYDLGKVFYELIEGRENFRLATKPQANILCFQYYKEGMENSAISKMNEEIRKQILLEGQFYIVKTQLHGQTYLRTTIMNPFTTKNEFESLLNKIEKIGSQMT